MQAFPWAEGAQSIRTDACRTFLKHDKASSQGPCFLCKHPSRFLKAKSFYGSPQTRRPRRLSLRARG